MGAESTPAKTILLVEDEKILADLLRRRLEERGYRVEIARDGEEGLASIRAHVPDLMLLDMQLPKLNGLSVLKTLESEGVIPQLPVIVISNSGRFTELDLIKKLGVRDYLVKLNFDPEEILSKVAGIFREPSVSEEVGEPVPIPAPTHGGPGAQSGRAPVVLIVEDDTFLSELLARAIQKKNLGIEAAANIEEARVVLSQKQVDLICLDAVLPGTDGFTFLTEIKNSAQFKQIPVLMLSNLGQKEEIERGMKLGAVGYFVKANKSPDEIVREVESLLGLS